MLGDGIFKVLTAHIFIDLKRNEDLSACLQVGNMILLQASPTPDKGQKNRLVS